MSAFVAGSAIGGNDGETTVSFAVPAGIEDGDLFIVAHIANNTNGHVSDYSAKGWTSLGGTTANTRAWAIFGRTYSSAVSIDDYAVTMNGAATAKSVSLAVRGHSVTDLAQVAQGDVWRRQDNGGSQTTIVAPSVQGAAEDLVLAFTGEQLVALETYTVTQASGFELTVENPEGPTTTAKTEWITAWSKALVESGPSGDLILDWSGASLNGVGAQLAVPSLVSDHATGNIGTHIATSPTATSITVGIDQIAGGTVEAVLGSTRQTITVDPTSGWGHTVFTGLAAGASYEVTFEVDGVEQTDASLTVRTLPTSGSFTMVTGSCQFTGSDHPVWDRIREDGPVHFAHMGDLHYADATTEEAWRFGVESSLTAPRMAHLLETVPVTWTWDNHDRIIADDGGAGAALNYGRTDPATNTEWRKLAGSAGWASDDTVGRTFVIGRVRFIQTDNWTAKDDPDAGVAVSPLTFLGTAQKQWLKDTLEAATEPAIVWLCQWTQASAASGRWDSFADESTELQARFNARPEIKARMVMVGGDSHSVQVTDGSRDAGWFRGIPSYNISGFNRSNGSGHGGEGWTYDGALRTPEQPEADWGGYSRITVTDEGGPLTLLWEGVRVGPDGTADVLTSQTLTFTTAEPGYRMVEYREGVEIELTPIEWDGTTETALALTPAD